MNELIKLLKEHAPIEEIKSLLEKGADTNATDEDGFTPLRIASLFNSNPEIIKALIEAGSDVNATDEEGRTVLKFMKRNKYISKKTFDLKLKKYFA